MTEEEIIKYIDENDYNQIVEKLFKEDVDAYGKPKKLITKLKYFYQDGIAEGFMDAMCK